MRKYIYLMLLGGMIACQEEELVRYSQEKDALQFRQTQDSSYSSDFNFATAYELRNDVNYYWGDSLAEVRMEVVMQLQGFPTPDERPYRLKTVLLEGQDASKTVEVRFDSYYSLAPNQLLDTIAFTVYRPKARGNYMIGLVVDTEGDDSFFEKGAEECAVYKLNIADRYDEPADWSRRQEWLGEFDQEKYAFMVTTGNKLFSRNDYHMWEETDLYNAELRAALARFNASVPEENRKKFTFPNMPKWVWWDNQTKWLGEFSIEKFNFIQEMIDQYGDKDEQKLSPDSKLEWWNLLFRQVLAEDERPGVDFPRNTERSSWWRESYLAEWALDKQEFVVMALFPKSNYQIGETTWDYAAAVLRRAVDEYNVAHPETPLTYEFVEEGMPAWWGFFETLFGPYSSVKRDIVVDVAVSQYGENGMEALKIGNEYLVANGLLPTIIEEVNVYNETHPGNEITDFPTTPAWWNTSLLGEYSEEKEEYMNYIVGEFGAGQWWTNSISEHWATVFRCCVDWYNQKEGKSLVNDFPVVNGKWYYWDNYSDVWGDYSDEKKTFVLWVLYRRIPGFGDYWEYTVSKAQAKQWLIDAQNAYNANNDPDLPFNFN